MKNIIILCLIPLFWVNAQVSIGAEAPDPSAALDVNTPNQGLLLNNVDITEPFDTTTIPDTSSSMIVYSTEDHDLGGLNEIEKDFVYIFNGTKWVRVYKNSRLDIDLQALKIPVFGMFAYSKTDFPLANTTAAQDITYPNSGADTFINTDVFERVNDYTFKALQDGVYMVDGFMNIIQRSTDISWGIKFLVSSDNGTTWSPNPGKGNYCNHTPGAGTLEPVTCVLQESFLLEENDLIKLVIFKRGGDILTSARLDATNVPLRYSSGFKIIYYPL